MLVIKRIEDHPAFSTRPDNARIAQQTQLMRDRGVGHPELEGEVTNAQLGAREGIEDAHTCGVSEHPEDLGQPFDGVCIES